MLWSGRVGQHYFAPGRRARALALLAASALAIGGCSGADSAPTPSAPAAGAVGGAPAEAEQPVVLFLGTSLTAGYGLPSDQAFPARVQQRIDDAGLAFRVVNAGVSGDTSAGGLARLDWLLRLPVAVLVLELGANDMLRGQRVDALRTNLQTIIDRTRAAHPATRFVVAGMQAAPNLGADYARAFGGVYRELADRNGAALIPFLLDGVAAVESLNQADGIHPTAEGQELVAATVWRALSPILLELAAG